MRYLMPLPLAMAILGGAILAMAILGGGPVAAQDARVRMLDNSFDPPQLRVDVDQPVTFVNDGRVEHNVVAFDLETFSSISDTGGNTAPGDEWTLEGLPEGIYQYFCSLHAPSDGQGGYQGMVGTLLVGDVEAEEPLGRGERRESTTPAEWTGVTRDVPDDYTTIQSAVDAAEPGDLILIQPGIYREAVSVTTPGLVIRGTDRNEVILDGELTRENGIAVTADGVAIENVTARGYTVNGFFWNGVVGYRGSYLTAIDDWIYGIYAFDSVDGLFEHSYASGSWDAGFYIGQCDPCDAVITDIVAEYNGLGYSGTNASGNLWIVNSEWRHNVAGIVPNTLDSELLPPTNDMVVAGNHVHDNGEDELAPNMSAEWSAFGNGILLAGVRDSVVRNNLIVNNPTSGVQVVSMIDAQFWPSGGNRIEDNVIRGSGRSDLALGGPLEQGTCFSGNDGTRSVPRLLPILHHCHGLNLPLWYGLGASAEPLGRMAQYNAGGNNQMAHGEAPKPDLAFASLPAGADAPVRPAVDVFASLDFDPDAIVTPVLDPATELMPRRPALFGVPLDGGVHPLLLGALLWWVPMLVWLLGGAWALWNLHRSQHPVWAKTMWTGLVVLWPTVGVWGYAGLAADGWSRGRRAAVTLGGLVAWLAIVIVALVVGGVL